MKAVWSLLIAIACLTTAASLTGANSIDWRTDFDQVILESKKLEKPIFLLFTMPDSRCPACEKLKKNLFEDSNFISMYGNKFLFAKVLYDGMRLDDETRARNESIEHKYKQSAFYPEVQIIGPVGKEVKILKNLSVDGNYNQNDFQKIVQQLEFALAKQKKQIVLRD